MHVRHRVPTVFSIYMLDVICCALGCVILLWHVSFDEAEKQTAAARQERDNYEQASREVRSASTEADTLKQALALSREEIEQLLRNLAAVRGQRDDALQLALARLESYNKTRANLAAREIDLASLRGALATLRETNKKTIGALARATDELDKTRTDLADATGLLDKTNTDLAKTTRLLDKTRTELTRSNTLLDTTRTDLARSNTLLDTTRTELTRASTTLDKTAAHVVSRDKLYAEMVAKINLTERQVRELEKDVAGRQAAADEAAGKLREQLALLQAAESRNKKLEQQIAAVRSDGKEMQTRLSVGDLRQRLLEQDLERHKKELADSGQRFKDLLASHDTLSKQVVASTRDYGDARAAVTFLQGEKRKLEAEKSRLQTQTQTLQAAVEQRFAGIELKGQNVVFLVDMSGSMQLIDSSTEDPDKWPTVCETVARLMRSLLGLQRYQVILFSDRPRYLFGYEGQWLKYDPDTSAKQVFDALKQTKPQGETNLHAVFNEAFRYRGAGLDTLYVLSDGLPNAGDGLPVGAEKLTEPQRTELLSKHLRSKLKTEWNRPLADRPRVHINTIGFFFESPDVGAFLWALAREHEGSFVGMSKP